MRSRGFSMAPRAAAALLALPLLAPGGTTAATPEESSFGDVAFGPEVRDFRMGIAMRKQPHVAGHPIALRFVFENMRRPPSPPVPWSTHGQPRVSHKEVGRGLEISLVGPMGSEVPKTLFALGADRRRLLPRTNPGSTVGPGETQLGGIALDRYYDLSMPGTYRVRVTRFRFGLLRDGVGDATSGEIVFEVHEPPETP